MTSDNFSGQRDSGQRDSGQRDSGQRDSGQRDSGQRDSGQRDSGQRDSGQRESGQRESGQRASGQRASGQRESGLGVGALARFVTAQEGVHDRALAEVRAGRKESHWMWFVFPQLAGLGRSEVSRSFAIASLDEARAYLADPVLGPRLREAAAAVLASPGESAEAIFGPIDGMKLRSSMTLFHRAAPGEAVFREVLERFFGGRPDELTDRLLGRT